MRSRAWGFLLAGLLLFNPSVLRAGQQFEIFDGHVYNGKYYPRVDIIEWHDTPEQPTYMDFHVYSKKEPLDLSFQLEQSDQKKVMLVNYYFPGRKEHQCRRVLAPAHFSEGYLVYRDSSDPDYDSIIVSMTELPQKKGRVLVSNPEKYASCEMDEPERLPASDAQGKPATVDDQKRAKSDVGALKKKGQVVPFSDW